jgi:hypothetical protein
MSSGIADGAKNIAFMIKQFEALKPVILAVGAVLLVAFAPVVAAVAALGFILAKGGSNLKKAQFANGIIPGGAGGLKSSMTLAGQTENAAGKKQRLAMEKQNKILDTGNKLKTIDNNATARKITLTGDQLALQELEKKFDVERIGLYAALNQSTDGETQMRLLSLIAIKDQNAALAGMIQKATQTTDALTTFRQAIIDAIKALISMVNMEIAKLNTQFPTALTSGGGGVSSNPYDPNAVVGGIPNTALSMDFGAGTFRAAESRTTNISVNVQGSVTTERDLVSAITQGIYNNQASGIPISYTTAFR